jgi:hypothetical protein
VKHPSRVAWRTCLAAILVAGSSHAFRTAGQLPEMAGTERVRWRSDVISYEISSSSVSPIPQDEFVTTVVVAFATWEHTSCTDLRFDHAGSTFAGAAPGDGRNTIQWVTSGWAARGWLADAAAITDVQYARTADGVWEIVEADMYLNADHQRWILAGDGGPDVRDVRSVVTHEAGHMLGLLHPCEIDGAGGAPRCSDVSGADVTTMYPIYSAAQWQLSADDEAGECFLYPRSTCDGGACPDPCATVRCPEGQLCQEGACRSEDAGSCTGNACPKSCSSSDDCAASQSCIASVCRDGVYEIGDPCVRDGDCQSHACSGEGFCAAPCKTDRDCAAGSMCMPDGNRSICMGTRAPMGGTCQGSADCLGNECLTGGSDNPVCTRACGPGHATCPGNWQCESVDGRSVCTPAADAPTGGRCSIGVPARNGQWPGACGFFGWTAAMWLRKRRRGLSTRRGHGHEQV